ncbi:MAG: helical backbone metal receptor [Thermoanaerobaculia bacterium]|nr:helical backbone metal receptor [Thermoanaerobaculia bacterium]
MRIVSLTCSNTEIVCALGLAESLVGVDDHSDYPQEVVAALPRVGPDLEIDVERVEALEPDIVLASLTVPGHEKVVARLEAAGLPFLAPEPESLEDVYRDIRLVAAALEVPDEGERVIAEMRWEMRSDMRSDMRSEAQEAQEAQEADLGKDRPSLLVQWWPKPVIAAGRCSWVHDMIELAGARNALEEDVKSRPMEDDEVAGLAPDAFVLSWCGVEPDKVRTDVVLDNPAFAGLEAVRCGRVFRIPEACLGRPSPRLVGGMRRLRETVSFVRASA